jgi:CheY-like chemotaxis protein
MNFEERCQVLAIDDEPNVTDLVRLFLETTSRYVVFAENRSGQAITTARAISPDLILLDLSMPGYDGRVIAQKLQLDPQLSKTPIMFFTSLISQAEAGNRATKERGSDSWQSLSILKSSSTKLIVSSPKRGIAREQRGPFGPLIN